MAEEDRWLVDLDAAVGKWRAGETIRSAWLLFLVSGLEPKKKREKVARAIRTGKMPTEVRLCPGPPPAPVGLRKEVR